MLVNLYADRMMPQSPSNADEVWNATHEHSRLYQTAATQLGMTPGEYHEFQKSLLDGSAVYVRLPNRVDAMAGSHHGSAYVVRNVLMPSRVMGWKVALRDGTEVYVPKICGNLSVVHPRHIAAVPTSKSRPYVYTAAAAVEPLPAPAPPENVVTFVPPPVAAAAPVAAVVPAASHIATPFLFLPLAGLAAIPHGGGNPSTPPAAAPPCSGGSNMMGVCSR